MLVKANHRSNWLILPFPGVPLLHPARPDVRIRLVKFPNWLESSKWVGAPDYDPTIFEFEKSLSRQFGKHLTTIEQAGKEAAAEEAVKAVEDIARRAAVKVSFSTYTVEVKTSES